MMILYGDLPSANVNVSHFYDLLSLCQSANDDSTLISALVQLEPLDCNTNSRLCHDSSIVVHFERFVKPKSKFAKKSTCLHIIAE